MNNRKGDWVQTYTGKQFWPLDPRPEDICIEDIAHALGNLCRFGGHCKQFYSVAEHSIYVSFYVGSFLAGLLHDASEAYLLDLPSPIKDALDGYKEFEENILKAVFERFNIFGEIKEKIKRDEIKVVDKSIRVDEVFQLMGSPKEWGSLKGCKPLGVKIMCLNPDMAMMKFLERFYFLTKGKE